MTLAECPSEESFAAKAFNDAGMRIAGTPFPYRAKVMIKRTEAVSCFAAIHEPYRGRRIASAIKSLAFGRGEGAAIELTFVRAGTRYRDVFIQTRPTSGEPVRAAGIELHGRAGLVRSRRTDGGDEPVFAVLMGGRSLHVGAITLERDSSGNACWRDAESE